MFTGIVEENGRIEKIEPSAKSIRLTISSVVCASDLKIGDSLAVNGCCLTVVKIAPQGARDEPGSPVADRPAIDPDHRHHTLGRRGDERLPRGIGLLNRESPLLERKPVGSDHFEQHGAATA